MYNFAFKDLSAPQNIYLGSDSKKKRRLACDRLIFEVVFVSIFEFYVATLIPCVPLRRPIMFDPAPKPKFCYSSVCIIGDN